MALEGSVGDFGIVDIFQLIGMQKKTGILTISCKNKEDLQIFFLDGTIMRAFSGDGNQRFSDALVSSEKVTVAQLRTAFRITENNTPIAESFIRTSAITLEEAKRWNRVLSQEAIFDLLSWKTGSYRFEQGIVAQNPSDAPINVEQILMEGMRQIDEWPPLLKKIPSRDLIYDLVKTDDVETAPDLSEKEEVNSILKFFNGERTVNDIMSHAGIGAFPVYKAISGLLSEGKIKIAEPKEILKKDSSEISIEGVKRLLSHPTTINGFLMAFTIGVASVFFYFVLWHDNAIFKKDMRQTGQLDQLTLFNKRDQIEFSLNLYYLKRNGYPNSLEQLKQEGFIEANFPLEGWEYSGKKSSFQLEFLANLIPYQ
jgi:hypothetical protein